MNSAIFLKNIVWLTCLGIFIMTLFRFTIAIAFGKIQSLWNHRQHCLNAFFLGLRYDLKVLAGINAVPLLALLIVQPFSPFTSGAFLLTPLFIYYIITFFILSIILMIDVGFFSYFNEHINYLVFGFFDDDTTALLKTFWKNYNVPLFIGLILIYFIALYLGMHFIWYSNAVPVHNGWLWLIVAIVITILLTRGNLQSMPLGLIHAHVCDDDFINKLTINGVLTYAKALKQRRENRGGDYDLAKKFGYSEKMSEAIQRIAPNATDILSALTQHVPQQTLQASLKPHVVLGMMESFSTHFLEFEDEKLDLLGALRKHWENDIVFKHFCSDGQGTIESFLSLVTNMPHRPNSTNYSESDLLNRLIPSSIAEVYRKAGYETSIIYGGQLSWRNIGIFLNHQGFDHVDGDTQIKAAIPLKSKSYEHPWGIHDEYVFDYALQKLQHAQKPQFILLLTTSNHPPFICPETYNAKPHDISAELTNRLLAHSNVMTERLRTYQYGNDCAGKFLDAIKTSALADNTIVGLTGDHAFWGMYHYQDNELFKRYTVPLYWYIPRALQPTDIDTTVFGSHKDIAATAYHLSLSNVNYLSIGHNLFDTKAKHSSFNSGPLIANMDGLVLVKNGEEKYYRWIDDALVKPCEKTPELHNLLEDYYASMSITDQFLRQLKN